MLLIRSASPATLSYESTAGLTQLHLDCGVYHVHNVVHGPNKTGVFTWSEHSHTKNILIA
jgi:hypothetical protein